MVVTCAIDHVKIQWQTILGFSPTESEQRVGSEGRGGVRVVDQ